MRTRGWLGSLPADDDEARSRIIDAAKRCIDRVGVTKTGLSDVAAELGVTRQTVYRLFSSRDALMTEVARGSAGGFLKRVEARAAAFDDPAEMLVEMFVYTLERLPKERYLGILLATSTSDSLARLLTNESSFEFSRAMIARLDVDWQEAGLDERDLDELIELFLRLIQSFALDPGRPRSRAHLRAFLTGWLTPMVRARMDRNLDR